MSIYYNMTTNVTDCGPIALNIHRYSILGLPGHIYAAAVSVFFSFYHSSVISCSSWVVWWRGEKNSGCVIISMLVVWDISSSANVFWGGWSLDYAGKTWNSYVGEMVRRHLDLPKWSLVVWKWVLIGLGNKCCSNTKFSSCFWPGVASFEPILFCLLWAG